MTDTTPVNSAMGAPVPNFLHANRYFKCCSLNRIQDRFNAIFEMDKTLVKNMIINCINNFETFKIEKNISRMSTNL